LIHIEKIIYNYRKDGIKAIENNLKKEFIRFRKILSNHGKRTGKSCNIRTDMNAVSKCEIDIVIKLRTNIPSILHTRMTVALKFDTKYIENSKTDIRAKYVV